MSNKNIDIIGAIDNCLTDAKFTQLPKFYRGKVRDAYDLPNGQRIMVATDRQSAFDIVLAAVPFKGQVLNETARFWFEKTQDICPNHVINYPDPNVIISKNLKMLPVEMVVRSYITGSTNTSIWPMYARGGRLLYGHQFPDGLIKNQVLPQVILTPTTKASQGEHDTPITAEEIIEQKLLTKEQWGKLGKISLALFARGQEIAAKNGLIFVDTKYEFGVDANGTITLADEIHTPDSSRYWVARSYEDRLANGQDPENLDKEFLRLWIAGRCDPYKDPIPNIPIETLVEFSSKYIQLYEQITGLNFSPPPTDQSIRDRIEANLKIALPEYFKK